MGGRVTSFGSVGALTLFVDDLGRAKEFYERVFHVDVIEEADAGTLILAFDNLFVRLLVREEAERELLGTVQLAEPGPVGLELSVRVDDALAARDALLEAGVEILFGPVDRAWGVRHVGFRDPDGHLWVVASDVPR